MKNDENHPSQTKNLGIADAPPRRKRFIMREWRGLYILGFRKEGTFIACSGPSLLLPIKSLSLPIFADCVLEVCQQLYERSPWLPANRRIANGRQIEI